MLLRTVESAVAFEMIGVRLLKASVPDSSYCTMHTPCTRRT